MIKESLYFSFAGRKSSEFGITSVSIQSGLFEEPFMGSRSIRESTVRGNPRPYLTEVETSPKTLTLSFFFEENYNDELLNEVTRWLNVSYYEPLFFSENLNKIFYAMPVDNISLIHNGLKQGYLDLSMRCDSPFSYSPEIVTSWKDCSKGELDIILENKGTELLKPIIQIKKITDGDLIIQNVSNGGIEFKFNNLNAGEELVVDCEYEEIDVNLTNTWRYDNFNGNYLSLPFGKNRLKVFGTCYLRFIYRHTYSN